jgi:HEAT repeat protein
MIEKRVAAVLVFALGLASAGSAAASDRTTSAPTLLSGQKPSAELQGLIEALESHSETAQREAVRKLRDMGSRAAPVIPDLIEVLGMGRFYWDGLDAQGRMTGGSIDFTGSAEQVLIAIGSSSVEPLLQFLKQNAGPNERESSLARAGACRVLGALKDERAFETLFRALRDSSPEVRQAAAEAVLRSENPALFDKVASALNSPNPDLRDASLWIMIQKKDDRVFAAIRRKLESPYPDIREEALSDLEAFGDSRVIPIVAGLLDKDPDADVKAKAARILGDLGDKSAVEALIRALQSPETEVVVNAASALGKLKETRAVGPLTLLQKDARPEVRDAAAAALKNIKAP